MVDSTRSRSGHVKPSNSVPTQRRTALPWALFEQLLAEALRPKAREQKHPEAFYEGLRLCGIDGSRFSVTNTPQVKKSMPKAASRRFKAAFAKVGVASRTEAALYAIREGLVQVSGDAPALAVADSHRMTIPPIDLRIRNHIPLGKVLRFRGWKLIWL